MQRQPGQHGVLDGPPIDDRQRPRQTQANRTRPGIRLRSLIISRTPAEHLAAGMQLHVHLKPNNRFVLHKHSRKLEVNRCPTL